MKQIAGTGAGLAKGHPEPESRFLSRAQSPSQGRFCAALLRNDSSAARGEVFLQGRVEPAAPQSLARDRRTLPRQSRGRPRDLEPAPRFGGQGPSVGAKAFLYQPVASGASLRMTVSWRGLATLSCQIRRKTSELIVFADSVHPGEYQERAHAKPHPASAGRGFAYGGGSCPILSRRPAPLWRIRGSGPRRGRRGGRWPAPPRRGGGPCWRGCRGRRARAGR
jgi:hypothetical protein